MYKCTHKFWALVAFLFGLLASAATGNAAVSCSGWSGKLIGMEAVATSCNANVHIMTGIQCVNGQVTLWSHQGDWSYGADFMANFYASQGYRVFRNTAGTRVVAVDKYYTEKIDGKTMSAYPTGSVYTDVFDKVLYPQASNLDADNDHYTACEECDDSDPTVNPGALEVCTDGKDNNCNGLIDCADQACASEPTCCTDGDGDGYSPDGGSCGPVDCNDADPAIHPGAEEVCDGIDNNCNSEVDEGLSTDADGDGHYKPDSCLQPADDCNDGNPLIHPGANEVCNDGLDNDCNGRADCVDTACSGSPVCFPLPCSSTRPSPEVN